jgi:uncharacterized membrane protein HdeD (DUF308 family)
MVTKFMVTKLVRNWWAFVLRGLFALLVGLIALVWPSVTIGSLTLVYGFYTLLDGIFTVMAAWSNRSNERWWVLLLSGLLGIAAGVITFVSPGVIALTLLTVIAVRSILTGLLEIVAAIRLRQKMENEWSLGLGGLASLIFGVLLLIWPASALVAISWTIGIYAFAFGIMMLLLGSRLHGLNKSIEERTADAV